MATVFFPAIVERGDASFGVYFPDLPGCVTAGGTVTEAVTLAEEALNGHLAVMAEHGDPIPDPSELGRIVAEDGSVVVCHVLVRGERLGWRALTN